MEIKKTIPKISAIQQNDDRPFLSVMIPTYNCAEYLGTTLESVLAQDLGPNEMQIEVIDDCSTKDDPEKVVRDIGKGRVKFYRNSINLGATQNFNNCLRRSIGRYVHILHGDDYVERKFYSTIINMIKSESDFGLYATRSFFMDVNGILESISPKFPESKPKGLTAIPFAQNNYFLFPGIVINRKCVEMDGGFDENFEHVADWDMWVRLIYNHGGVLSNTPLAYYRLFDQNDSSRHRRTGNNLIEMIRAFQGFYQMIPQLDSNQFFLQMRNTAYLQYIDYYNKNDKFAAEKNFGVWKSITPLIHRLISKIRSIGKKILN